MSYRAKPRRTYQPYKMRQMFTATPHHHEVFRREWEANFINALNQAKKLQEKGFMVDESLNRGALMESQAKRLAEQYRQAGCEVQLIPVAKWAGENVVFLVYKPPSPEAPPPTAEPASKVKTIQLTPEQLIERFDKNFKTYLAPGQPTPSPQYLNQHGYLIEAKHLAALIDPDSPKTDPLLQMYRDAKAQGLQPTQILNTPKLRKAVKAFMGKAKGVIIGQTSRKALNIEHFYKALLTFGDGPVNIYTIPDEFKPYYISRNGGYAIAAAPIVDPSPNETVNLETLTAV